MQIFGVSPFFKLQNNTLTTIEKWDIGYLPIFGWAVLKWYNFLFLHQHLVLHHSSGLVGTLKLPEN